MYEYLLKEYKMGLGMCDVTDISMENGNFFHVTILLKFNILFIH